MKISQLIIVLIVAGLGVAGIKYSLDQKTIMDLLVTTHGGGALVSDSEATGLRQANRTLDGEASTASSERADAVKASDSARLEMRDHRDKRDDSKAQLARDKDELASWENKVKQAEARVEQIKAEYQAAVAELQQDLPDIGDEADLASAMEKLKSVVEQEKERNQTLTTDLEGKVADREAATEKVAGETAELARVVAINDRFFSDYHKNKEEFIIDAVDPRWNLVVFSVGKDSGLVAGDTTPILVKRGDTLIARLRITNVVGTQVTAEYEPSQLPAGVNLQVGDKVFREKPVGG